MAPVTTPQKVFETAYNFDGLGRLASRTGTHFYFSEPIAESYSYDSLVR